MIVRLSSSFTGCVGSARLGVAVAAWLASMCAPATGQLVAERSCATVGKPMVVSVGLSRPSVPDPADSSRPATAVEPPPVRLVLLEAPYSAPGPTVIASVEVPTPRSAAPIRVDLAELFPEVWRSTPSAVRYVQLEIGGEPAHAALMLIPMLTPAYAPRADRTGAPVFIAPAAQVLSGYWLLTDRDAVVTIAGQDLRFRLRADAAPGSVMAFRSLVDHGFYDGTPVFRIASLRARPEPDIVQFGDPTGTGLGGPGTMIDLEDSPLRQGFGVLSFARAADPNSAGSQVVIGLSGEGVRGLQGRYAAFGELLGSDGAGRLLRLGKTPVDDQGRPREPLMVDSVRLVDAAPLGKGLEPANDPAQTGTGRTVGR